MSDDLITVPCGLEVVSPPEDGWPMAVRAFGPNKDGEPTELLILMDREDIFGITGMLMESGLRIDGITKEEALASLKRHRHIDKLN